MAGDADRKDRQEARTLAIALIALVALLGLGLLLFLPSLAELAATHLAPGLGLRDSAILSFIVTVALMIIFAIVSGDGLLGELQFVLAGFFVFFLIFWLMIAWLF